MRHDAKCCADRSNHCRDIAIFGLFRMAAAAILDFLKLQISKCGTRHECRIASPCQISWRSVKPLPRCLDVGFFKMAAAAILDFKNFKYLENVHTTKRSEVGRILRNFTENYHFAESRPYRCPRRCSAVAKYVGP